MSPVLLLLLLLAGGVIAYDEDRVLSNPEGVNATSLNMSRYGCRGAGPGLGLGQEQGS